jgi:hypothetical protein
MYQLLKSIMGYLCCSINEEREIRSNQLPNCFALFDDFAYSIKSNIKITAEQQQPPPYFSNRNSIH